MTSNDVERVVMNSLCLNLRRSVLLTATAALAACGGGGGYSGSPPPTVTSATASAGTMYGQTLLVTVQGSNLDQGVAASSAGCKAAALSTTAPTASTATTAYFKCTVSGVGAQQLTITRSSDGGTLATVPFTVAVPQVTLQVSNVAGVAGSIVITLDPAKAPLTVDNFLAYVNAGFYAGTVFHRNVPGFVIQGGGYAGPLVAGGALPTHKPVNAKIVLEDSAGLSNLRYTVAMARSSQPDTADSEFFINLANNTGLDRNGATRGYAVFGSVTAGTDVVGLIELAPCLAWPTFFGVAGPDCLPSPNITVVSATQTR